MKDSEEQVGSGPALERKACSQVRFGTALGDRSDGPAAPGTAVRDAFDGQVGSGMAVCGPFERQVREKGNLAKIIVLLRKNNGFRSFGPPGIVDCGCPAAPMAPAKCGPTTILPSMAVGSSDGVQGCRSLGDFGR